MPGVVGFLHLAAVVQERAFGSIWASSTLLSCATLRLAHLYDSLLDIFARSLVDMLLLCYFACVLEILLLIHKGSELLIRRARSADFSTLPASSLGNNLKLLPKILRPVR